MSKRTELDRLFRDMAKAVFAELTPPQQAFFEKTRGPRTTSTSGLGKKPAVQSLVSSRRPEPTTGGLPSELVSGKAEKTARVSSYRGLGKKSAELVRELMAMEDRVYQTLSSMDGTNTTTCVCVLEMSASVYEEHLAASGHRRSGQA